MKKGIVVSFLIATMFLSQITNSYASLITLDDGMYMENSQYWNIDMEETTLAYDGAWVTFCDKNGVGLKNQNSGDKVGAHTGSTSSKIKIEENTQIVDNPNGKSVSLETANASDTVQFNNLIASIGSDGVAVIEYDAAFSDFNCTRKLIHPVYYVDRDGTKADSWDMPFLRITNQGEFMTSAGSQTLGAERNRWYRISSYVDFPSKKVYYYIDGNLLEAHSFSNAYPIIGIYKYVVSMQGAAGKIWIDNLKIYDMTKVPEIEAVTSNDKNLSIEFSSPVSVSNFIGSENEIKNIFAEYDGNVLNVLSCSADDTNENILNFTTDKSVFTAVPIDIDITIENSLSVKADISYTYTAPAASYDVINVSKTTDEESYTIEASFNAPVENTVMMVVLYDDAGTITSINLSDNLDISVAEQKIVLQGLLNGANTLKVYFIDNFTSFRMIKNVIY